MSAEVDPNPGRGFEPARLPAVALLLGAAVLGASGATRGLDEAVWDRLQRRLPARATRVPFALVGIGEASLARLGPFPFPRRVHARVLDALVAAGATLVAVDVLFDGATDPEDDALLGAAVARSRALIPYQAGAVVRMDAEGGRETIWEERLPPEPIRTGAAGLGFADLPVDSNPDGIYRRIHALRLDPAGRVHRPLGAALAERVAGAGSWAPVPVGLVRLDYRALRDPGAVPEIEFADLLEGAPGARERVRGRVCMVAATAPGLGDIKDTPIGRRPGAIIHLAFADALLGTGPVRECGRPGMLLGLVPAGLAATLMPPVAWPVAGALAMLVAMAMTAALGGGGFFLAVGPGLAAGLGLSMLGVAIQLAGSTRAGPGAPDPEAVRAELAARLAAGDPAGVRGRLAELPEALRQDPRLKALAARALAPAHMEGALGKLLAGSEAWDLPADEREALAGALEAEGYLELALGQLEELYLRGSGSPGVGDRLFALRAERDRRWGVLSPRASRDLLGHSFTSLAPLGEGAEALVFSARERGSGREVVVKVIHPRLKDDPAALVRFRNECAVLAELREPRFPRLFGSVRGRLPYLVLEKREGRPLGATPRPPVAAPERFMAELAGALARLHAAGWVHRDVKPGNLLVGPEGTPVLLDFGLAARIGEPAPGGGTEGFAAPEQLAGASPHPAQDCHALGRLAAWLGLAGERWTRATDPDPARRPTASELAGPVTEP